MNRNDNLFRESRPERLFTRVPVSPFLTRHNIRCDDTVELNAIAHSEGWLTPPAEVTRITLKPWQQAVFWGLRVYIIVMLIIMGFGFLKVTGS